MGKDLASLNKGDAKVKQRCSISKCKTVMVCEGISGVGVGGRSERRASHNTSTLTPTLNLSLSEVGHLRSVLVREEIEVSPSTIDSNDSMSETVMLLIRIRRPIYHALTLAEYKSKRGA